MTYTYRILTAVLRLCAVAAPLLAQEDVVRVEQWRVHEGDDPRWSAPAFDDSRWQPSSWPRRHTTAQAFFAGTRWYRATAFLPLRLAGQPLALAMAPLDEVYDVFVNGVRIGTVGEWKPMPAGRFPLFTSFPIPESALEGPRVHLAIRRWTGGSRTNFAVFAASGILQEPHPPEIGPARLIRTQQELRRVSNPVTYSANPLVSLGIAVVGLLSLAMFFSQRASRSNLWLGVALLAEGLGPLLGSAVSLSSLPLRSPPAAALLGLQFLSPALWSRFLAEICPRLRTPLLAIAMVQIGIAFAAALGYAAQFSATWALTNRWAYIGMLAAGVTAISLLLERRRDASSLVLAAALTLPPAAQFWFTELSLWLGLADQARYLNLQGLIIDPRNVARLIFGVTAATVLYLRHQKEQQRQAGIDRELAAARIVQESLLASRIVATPGFAVDAAYLPASEVGGDFYQELAGPDGSLLVLVGDVSGKGLRAALLVGHISGALSNERSRRPAEVLANLNQSLVGRVSGGFVTCCCARFHPDGTVTIASAGHPAPYADGRELEVATGLPLGIAPGVTYDESTATGHHFTFISDGVVEAENAQRELFGFDRTRAISTRSAQEIADAAKARGQNDDITVVTVRRNA